jgi:hypothetical protein
VHGGKHGKKENFETEVQPEGFKGGRTRDARIQAREAEVRPQRKKGEESQAGHRYRTFRGAPRRRKGTQEEIQFEEKELQQIQLEKEVKFREEILRPQEVFEKIF